MSSISNVVTPQPGLISTNPFLSGTSGANLSMGGTTTPSVGGTTGGQQIAGIPYSSGTPATPVTGNINISSVPGTSINNGVLPSSSSTGGSSGINSYGLTPSSPNWYQLQPGESVANYNARTQDGISSTPTVNTSGTSAGSGTGGGQAPAGMMYNGTGGLVPIDNSTTVNSSGQNTPISTNVATGGGTQTNFPSIVGGLASTAATSSPQYQAAQQTYEQAAQQLATLQQQAGAQNTAILGGRTGAQEAGGEQGLLQNYLASQEAPLTGQEQAAAASMAAATGQQGTQQSGLAAAGGLASPTAANPYGTYNPLNPTQYTGYGGGSTGSGAAAAGGVQSQVQQGSAVQTMTGIYQQAQALSSNLSTAIQQAGYNPASGIGPATTFANGVNQWLQTQSGNPQYQNVANLISEVASKYANILQQSGGTPTSVSQVQQQIINGLASGQQIQTVLQSLATNAQASINALSNAAGTNANGSNTNTSTGYQPYFGS